MASKSLGCPQRRAGTLDDPAGKTVEQIRPIRDEIERCIRTLIDEIA
jgi:hypothetical protein